jgi:methanogenic corrinoid protein MtbC1
MSTKEEDKLYEKIIKGFVEFKAEEVKRAINKALEEGMDAFSIQENGLRKGLERLGELFEKNEIFIPHPMLGAKISKKIGGQTWIMEGTMS